MTVGESCGPGEDNAHDHDPEEFLRCRKLSEQAAAILKGESAIGSEAGEPYLGFYIAANRGDAAPEAFTPDGVRRFFGGTIYPQP